ncbi:MAG: tetratricopeptide repeat protein, partial [Chthoniobacterales bacterium]
MVAPAPSTPAGLSFWILGALLVAAVIFAYQPAWQAGYIWDDDMYVTNNPLLTAADGLRRIWFSFDAPSEYFPLTYTTFRIEHALWGFDSAGYHWINILLHAANALLLWRVLRLLNVRAAWFAAALFALHPVQVESVAWISERKNVLMGFFFLAALLGWLRFIEEKPGRAWRWLALSFVLYLLALSAKTTACTFPAALVLVLWWKRKPITGLRWLQISPFVLAGLGAGALSMLWERMHQGGRADYIPIGFLERGLTFSRAIWFYLSKLAWPSELIFSYPRWNISPSDPTAYVWVVALLVLIGAIFYARRWLGRGPEVAFAFFVLTLSPLLGLVIVVTFLFSFVADHYQYLACIGPLALFAASCDVGVGRLSWPGKTWLARAGAGVILAALAAL